MFLFLIFVGGLLAVPTAIFTVKVCTIVYKYEPIWIWFLCNTIFTGLLFITICLSCYIFANSNSISWKCFEITYLVFLILSISLIISGSILYSNGEFTYENKYENKYENEYEHRNSIVSYSKSSFILTIIIAIILLLYIITGFISRYSKVLSDDYNMLKKFAMSV